MSRFDTVLVVDWAAGKRGPPKPAKDQIWIGAATAQGAEAPVYFRTRHDAQSWLQERLEREIRAGRRVLACFDFPFAYPKGFARHVTGDDDPLALWAWYAERVHDAPDGENNRFDLAAGINAGFGGKGPFWGNALPRDIDGLPRNQTDYELYGLPQWRGFETQIKGLQTCWKLAGAGCVGSQVIRQTSHVMRCRCGCCLWRLRLWARRTWPR